MDIKKVIATTVASSMMITSVVSFANNVSAYRLPAKYTDVSVRLSGLTEEHLKRVPLSMILDNMTYASDVYAEENENSEPAVSDGENSEPVASDGETSEPATSDGENSEPTTSDGETSEPAASDGENSEPATSDGETSEPATSDGETSEPTTSDGENSEPATSDGENSEPATSDGETSEPAASDGENSEPAASDGETSEPAASDGENSEPATSDGETSEPAASDGGTSEPAASDDETSEPETDNGETESVDVDNEHSGELIVGVAAGDPIETGTEDQRELVHRKDDKVEFSADAAYIRIDDMVYSLSDETATVNLFEPNSPDEYVLVKEVIVSSDDSFDSDDECFIASFFITKNFWSFDEFRFYTENENEEKVYLKTKPAKELENSVSFTVFSPLDSSKNIYLEAVPGLVWNDTVRGDVDIEITYHGQNAKAENILENGTITLDLRAFDGDGLLITEQYGITVSLDEESFMISADIVSDDAFENVEKTVSVSEGKSKLSNAAEFDVDFEIASYYSEFVLKIYKLGLVRADKEIVEENILGAYLGHFGSLDEITEETANIASELFGDGIKAAGGTKVTLFIDPESVPELVTVDADAFVLNITFNIDVSDPDIIEPDTSEPTTSDNETSEPTTSDDETSKPTTSDDETSKPTTSDDETSKPTTSDNETSKPTTSDNETSEPTTSDNNSEPTTSDNNSEPATSDENSEPASDDENSQPAPSVKFWSGFGDRHSIFFNNLKEAYCELLIAYSGELSDLEISLIDADNITLGNVELIQGEAADEILDKIEAFKNVKLSEQSIELMALAEAIEAVEAVKSDESGEIGSAADPGELDKASQPYISDGSGEPEKSDDNSGETSEPAGHDPVYSVGSAQPAEPAEVKNNDYGVIRICIDPVRDGYGRLFEGKISGRLLITDANAAPLEIPLDGRVDVLKITRRVTGTTPVKFIPYETEFMMDGNVDHISAEFSANGLPDGLKINKKTGKISGIPENSGEFTAEISAKITFIDDNGETRTAVITREASLDVAVNSARNLHMNSDPNYAIASFLGDSFDGRTYYLDDDDIAKPQEINLKGDVAEFVDLWINGVKIKRESDDYKQLHGSSLIKFGEYALENYEKNEIYTIVFAFKSAENDRMIYAAQNFSIVEDKASVPVTALDPEDYKDVYTPANRLDETLDREIADVLGSVKLYTEQNAFKFGQRLVVKPYSTEYGYPAMTIIMVDENGAPVETDSSMTVGIALPESYEDGFNLYGITNGIFEPMNFIDIKDGRLFFGLDTAKSYAVSRELLDELGEPVNLLDPNGGTLVSGASAIRFFGDQNPVTGIAVSGAGIVVSGTALALIFFTGKRRKSSTKTK